MPVVELTVTGRKSGKEHTVMLTAPVVNDDRVVLVASKGGADEDPQWYRNLVANPDVWITVGGERRPMRARTATPGERAALWPRCVAAYSGYGEYQQRTDRTIPLVILQPR